LNKYAVIQKRLPAEPSGIIRNGKISLNLSQFYIIQKMTSTETGDESNRRGRRLEAIMFTDIVGYTSLTQANEDLALEALEKHNRLLRASFQKHHGSEVKTIGDSFLVEFDSALDAFNCAVEIQSSLRNYGNISPSDWKLKLRIGIHLGDVIHKGNDILGDAVNIASRIQPLAEPGGICISEQVYAQVHNKTEVRLQQLQKAELKNVSFETKIYSVMFSDDDKELEQENESDSRRNNSTEKLKVAVLPFSNLSPNPEDAYIADGMTEEIITTLSGINALSVISRTSVMGYKGTTKKVREIGKELDVGSVLEGSLRKAGNRIRISAQLIDVSRDKHLWAQNYDRQLDDVFEIQTDIASKIAEQLKIKLIGSEKVEQDAPDIDAYTMYMKAIQLLYDNDKGSIMRSIELLDGAVEKDPRYARAMAGLSDAWMCMAVNHYEDWTASLEKAGDYAKRAVELDPDLDKAHSALAQVFHANDEFEKASLEARRAIQLNPSSSEACFLLGMNDFFVLGKKESGLKELERSRELDPLRGSTEVLAFAYDLMGRGTEALDLLLKLRYIEPKNSSVYDDIANHYFILQDFQNARQAIEDGLKIEPNNKELLISRGIWFALTGERENAKRVLGDLLKSENESNRLDAALYIGAVLGDLDQAFEALMRLAETHAWAYHVRVYPFFENLRKDPRYKKFCEKVGIPQ
jgi:adenylate cyclase